MQLPLPYPCNGLSITLELFQPKEKNRYFFHEQLMQRSNECEFAVVKAMCMKILPFITLVFDRVRATGNQTKGDIRVFVSFDGKTVSSPSEPWF